VKHLKEHIEVMRPVEDVFRYTSNFANIEQWDPGVTESVKLTPGPVGAGSRFRVFVRSGLSTTAMTYEIVEFESPHRVVLEGRGGNIHAVDTIVFTPTEEGTMVDYSADISLGGAAGLVEPLIGGLLERVGRNALAGLGKALAQDSGPAGESLFRDWADRLVLPGAIGFTRFGYERRRRDWRALTDSLAGRTAVVTGATSGLGRETAGRLADLGARVVLVGRSADKLARAAAEIIEHSGNSNIVTQCADLSLMEEVRSLARRLLLDEPAIHVLVNNAAVLPDARRLTKEGLETAFATDLLSPWLLTDLLIPRLRDSAPARVVNVLSGGMYLSGIELDDLQNLQGDYDGSRAYARAKRGLMMLTEHWAGELEGAGVVVNAMHPGWADTPGVRTSLPGFHRLMHPLLRTPEQGADTIVWLAAAPEAGEVTGKFWLDREPHLSAIFPGTRGTRRQRAALLNELERLAA
jgi:dehydrogenase/reductase SDR family protein 12